MLDPVVERDWDVSTIGGLPQPAEELFATLYSQLVIAPLGPGRICLAGSFGRAWIATVAFDEKTGRASGKVFHEAAEARNPSDAAQDAKSDVAFNPQYALGLRFGDPERNRILLGREAFRYRPLILDPDEPSVRTIGEPLVGVMPHADREWFSTADSAYLVEEDPRRSHRNRLIRFSGPDMKKTVVAEGLPEGSTTVTLYEKQFHFSRRVPHGPTKLGGGDQPPPWEWWVCDQYGKNLKCIATGLPPIESIGISVHHGIIALREQPERAICAVNVAGAKPLPIELTSSLKCEAEKTARSMNSEIQSKLILRNETDQSVRLYWLDFGGRRQFYAEIPAGKVHLQPSFLEQQWVLTDCNDDAFEVIRTTEAELTHTIRKPAKK